jgi:flagellar hook protein FlgE
MSTALTGMSAAETTINVVGNNLANSSTVGFKASQADFATQFLQTLSLGSAPTQGSGGTDPVQTGLGTTVAQITPNFSQGTIETVSTPTDMAIQGDGFFIVQGSSGQQLFTRNGTFTLNSANQLVDMNGNQVMGYGVNANYQIQRTQLTALSIPLGSSDVAQATQNVTLQGTLSPTGDVATTASILQSGVLGDAQYSAPATAASLALASSPDTTGITSSPSQTGSGALSTGQYQYEFVYADGPAGSTPPATESSPSSPVTVNVANGNNQVELDNIPAPNAADNYNYVRVYRTAAGGSTFYYDGEINLTNTPAPASFTDTLDDTTLQTNTQLNTNELTGNYSYYVTFANETGGPPNGLESRPTPLAGPLNVVDGRIQLTDLPTAPADSGWVCERIYRNSATDSGTFNYLGEIDNVTDPGTFTDSTPDSAIANNRTINLNGPEITANTKLDNVLELNGSTYQNVFQNGTLEFAGQKGGVTLATKSLTITGSTTVLDLMNFLDDSMGIQSPPGNDLNNPIPSSEPDGNSPGAKVVNGQIQITGNNGTDNAIQIGASGLQLTTSTGTQNVNLTFNTTQQAVGESATTDFVAYDSLGSAVQVRVTAVLQSTSSTGTTYRWFADSPDNQPLDGSSSIAVGTGLINFDGQGNFVSATNDTVSIYRSQTAASSPLQFKLDFSQISGLSASSSSLSVSNQDGSAPGTLSSYQVGTDGTISGVYSNGVTRDLGMIQIARFANNAGLQQQGGSLYSQGVNSGLPQVEDPGQQGAGTIVAGAVEQSNTDIGSSLIDLILASTMYSGNSRVITTAQQCMTTLLQLMSTA